MNDGARANEMCSQSDLLDSAMGPGEETSENLILARNYSTISTKNDLGILRYLMCHSGWFFLYYFIISCM